MRSADGSRLLVAIHLKDVVKAGIKERLSELRRNDIRTVVVTGDNPVTAAPIALEVSVDDFIAEAKPQDRLFTSLAKSASEATDFFQIPTGCVVEVGIQVTI